MRWTLPLLACGAMLATASSIPAQEVTLRIDPAQSTVEFSLGATLHTVHGSFRFKRGDLRFDPATGKAGGEIVVNATSATTANEGRDRKMHSTVLESVKYPEIVFRPDRVEGHAALRGASQVRIHGVLLIHGSEHEVTLPVTVEAADGQYTATSKFPVPYIKWGMKNPSVLFIRVSDTVEVTVHAVARVVR